MPPLLTGGLIGGGGGAGATPPTWVNVLGGDASPVYAYGNINNVAQAVRTIDRSEFGTPSAGDICIACHIAPGYVGQSLPSLREGVDFPGWSNVIGSVFHTFTDTSELSGGLWVRECDGTVDDSCRIGSHGPYPSFTQIVRLSGNPFTFPGTISADNDSVSINPDAAGCPCVNDLFGGWNECIEFFVCWKRATLAESLIGEIHMPAGITELGFADGLENGFGDGMVCAWGMHYSHTFADRFNGGGATQNNANSAYGASVGARYKTSDS